MINIDEDDDEKEYIRVIEHRGVYINNVGDIVSVTSSDVNYGNFVGALINYFSTVKDQLEIILMFMGLLIIITDVDKWSDIWYISEILVGIFTNNFGYLNLLSLAISVVVSFIYLIRENIERLFIYHLTNRDGNILFENYNLFGNTLLHPFYCKKYSERYSAVLRAINLNISSIRGIGERMIIQRSIFNVTHKYWKEKKELNYDYPLVIFFSVFLLCGLINIIYTIYLLFYNTNFATVLILLVLRFVAFNTLTKITYLLFYYKKTCCTWHNVMSEINNILYAREERDIIV